MQVQFRNLKVFHKFFSISGSEELPKKYLSCLMKFNYINGNLYSNKESTQVFFFSCLQEHNSLPCRVILHGLLSYADFKKLLFQNFLPGESNKTLGLIWNQSV